LKGNVVDFHTAMTGELSKPYFDKFVNEVRMRYKEEKVQTGAFGQRMKFALVGDGPVTIQLDSRNRKSN